MNVTVKARDVNERLESLEFFSSIPGKEFLDFRESRLTRPPDNRPTVREIIALRLLSVDPAYQTHRCRRGETKNSGVSKR